MKSSIITKKYFKDGEPLRGFTIIELVVSIFILSIALVGIFSAFSTITILTSDSADRLTATYLGQEGMEIVRNIRDTNWLYMDAGDATWLDGLDICISGCEADYTTGTTAPGAFSMSMATGRYLYIDANGFYVHSIIDASKTKFQRKITITPLADVNNQPNDHVIAVKVQVSWDKKATILNNSTVLADTCTPSNCITIEGTFYDWYNYAPQQNPF